MKQVLELRTGVWRTKDGRDILIHDLDCQHLFHIIQMLETKGVSATLRAKELEGTDRAEWSDEDVIADTEAKLSRLHPFAVSKYKELIAEREKRIMAGDWNPMMPRPRKLPIPRT